MKITYVFTIFVILLRTSNQQCLSQNDAQQARFLNLYTGEQKFALDLLQTINQLEVNKSFVFSPYSIYHTLLISYFLASGKTETELRRMLRLNDSLSKVDLFAAYKLEKFVINLSMKNVTYGFFDANKVFVGDQIRVRECVLSLFQELTLVPFKTNPYGSVDTINAWVKESTRNMIKELLVPGSIDQSAALALISAAYFNGKWKKEFNRRYTNIDIFYVTPTKSFQVAMMEVEGNFNHEINKEIGAHILEIPFEEKETSMYVVLPPFTSGNDIFKVLKIDKLQSILEKGISNQKKIRLKFPKFFIEHTIELKPALISLGVGEMFKKSANFSVLSTYDNVTVNKVFHKAKLVVTEEGSSAEEPDRYIWRFAGQVVEEPVNFICNHPFVFVIYQKSTRTILFAGIFRGPP